MARIGSANIALLRPDFGDTNELFKNSMETLIGAGKPLQEAMASNFDYMKQQKVGELNNMLQQIAPQDPSNPQAMQEYLAEAQSLAEANGLNKWGINAGGAINVADKLIDRNQAVEKEQGANLLTSLANRTTKDTQTFNELANSIRALGGSNDDIMRAAAAAGVTVNANDLILTEQAKAVGIAKNVQDSNNQLIQTQNALKQLQAEIEAGNGYATAAQKAQYAQLTADIQSMYRNAGAGGSGKSQGQEMSLSTSSTSPSSGPSSFKQALIQSESSGKSDATITIKDGRQFGGLMQLGAARLKDYANATKTKPMTPEQFRKLPANIQNQVNDWHINSLTEAAKKTGAVGKVIKGIPMTIDAMVAMAHLGGTGGMQKFISTNGAYDPMDQNKVSLSDYARKFGGGGGTGGGSSGVAAFDVTPYIEQLKSSGSPNSAANTQEALLALRDRIKANDTLLKSSPQIDLNSAALPDFVGKSTGSAQDALKMFAPQADFINADHITTMDAINKGSASRVADIELSIGDIGNNTAVQNVMADNLTKARAEAAASGSNKVPFSSIFGGDPQRQKEGIALLSSAGYTSDTLAQLDPPTQKLIMSELIKYMNANENFKGVNKAKYDEATRLNIKITPPTGDPKKDKPPINKKSQTILKEMLHARRAKDVIKWKKEQGIVGKQVRKLPIFTSAQERQRNVIAVQDQMIDITNKLLINNRDAYNNIFKGSDMYTAITKAEEIYKTNLGLNDIHDYKDLDGFTNKLENPGLFEKALKQSLNELKNERAKESSALLKDSTQMSFKDTLDQAIRGSLNDMIGTNPNK